MNVCYEYMYYLHKIIYMVCLTSTDFIFSRFMYIIGSVIIK